MASLLTANLPSEDEEDDDFDPTGEALDGEDAKKNKASKRKVRSVFTDIPDDEPLSMPANEVQQQEDDVVDEEHAVEQAGTSAAAQPIHNNNAAEDSKEPLPMNPKTEAVWQSLNKGSSLAALSTMLNRPAASQMKTKKKKKRSADELWMRELGLIKPKKAAKPAATTVAATLATMTAAVASSSNVEAKTTVEPEPSSDGAKQPPRKATAASAAALAVAAAALETAKAAASATAARQFGKVTVMETRRFAGKDIEVAREVAAAPAAQPAAAATPAADGSNNTPPTAAATASSSGLDAVLEKITGPKKLNVLDKTTMDWKSFKKDNAAIEEELETYKKSGDKYLDKVNFLQTSQLREYEKERDQRLASDVRTRGRL